MSILAINGGSKEISKTFSRYNTIGAEEVKAVTKVLESGVLSDFIGAPGEYFLGGETVRNFERVFSEKFNVSHCVSVNSWTSGLTTIMGAIGLEPGDEVLVSPWTMTASATAILHWNAIPVFIDIEHDMYCIDPEKIEEKITSRTKAILVIDIFGQSAEMDKILSIARKHNLLVVSDCAQSPGTYYKGKLTGTLADIGGFSFNYHKHIHTGEGGMIVTNSDDLSKKCQLIRNHAEAVIHCEDISLVNMLGNNFRMGEIEAAIGLEQLEKLENAVISRQAAATIFNTRLSELPGLKIPKVREGCTHGYYFYGMQHSEELTSVNRDKIYEALVAEGVPYLSRDYMNLHLYPMYQKKIAYGSSGFPWTLNPHVNYDYSKGICPVAEKLVDNSFIGIFMCGSNYTMEEANSICDAFEKVYNNLDELV